MSHVCDREVGLLFKMIDQEPAFCDVLHSGSNSSQGTKVEKYAGTTTGT
jgi:hypothetical protein